MKKIILALAISALTIGSSFADSIFIKTVTIKHWAPVFTIVSPTFPSQDRYIQLCTSLDSSCGSVPAYIDINPKNSHEITWNINGKPVVVLSTSYTSGGCNYIITLDAQPTITDYNNPYCSWKVYNF